MENRGKFGGERALARANEGKTDRFARTDSHPSNALSPASFPFKREFAAIYRAAADYKYFSPIIRFGFFDRAASISGDR